MQLLLIGGTRSFGTLYSVDFSGALIRRVSPETSVLERALKKQLPISCACLLSPPVYYYRKDAHTKIAHISIQLAKHEALLNIYFIDDLHCFIGVCL